MTVVNFEAARQRLEDRRRREEMLLMTITGVTAQKGDGTSHIDPQNPGNGPAQEPGGAA